MFWKTREFERLAPIAFGILTFALLAFYRGDIAAKFAPGGWQTANLYGAVFQWASIQSGFVFAIYGFIGTKRDGFVGVLARGDSFEDFLGYARRAYLGGFALTFVSLPIMVVAPSINDLASRSYWIVAAWFACFVWTFCSFLRVAFIFGMIAAAPSRKVEFVG